MIGYWKIKKHENSQIVKDSLVNKPSDMSFLFDLEDKNVYECWRNQKLRGYPEKVESLLIKISDFQNPSDSEVTAWLPQEKV